MKARCLERSKEGQRALLVRLQRPWQLRSRGVEFGSAGQLQRLTTLWRDASCCSASCRGGATVAAAALPLLFQLHLLHPRLEATTHRHSTPTGSCR